MSLLWREKKIQHFLYTMQKRMLVEREIFLTSSLQIKGILIHSLGICKKILYHNWFYDCFQSKLVQPRCMRQVHMNNFVETRNHQLPVFRILTVMCIYSITGTSMNNMLVTVLSVNFCCSQEQVPYCHFSFIMRSNKALWGASGLKFHLHTDNFYTNSHYILAFYAGGNL